MTKKVKGFYESYKRASATTLNDVYTSYSSRKASAFEWCRNKCEELNGFDFKVVSACTNFFTVGFMYPDPETGEIRFCYETHLNTYDEKVEV